MRLVAYIDDFLIMAETEEKSRDHTEGLLYLLENLGFMIHPEKKITIPTQEIEFLGMVVDSRTMELRLSGQKIKKLRQEAAKIRDQAAMPTGWDVSHLLDKFNSVSQAILPAPLFCRALQRDLTAALGGGTNNSTIFPAPCHQQPQRN